MVIRISIHGCFTSREKYQEKQRQTCDYPYPAHKFTPVLDALQILIYKNQQNKNEHAKLKQKSQLVIGPFQAFNEHKLVKCQNTKDKSLDNRVRNVQPECSALFTTNI